MTAVSDTIVVEGSGSTSLVPSPADIASSVTDATKKVHGKLLGGVEWYFEHWVDLFEEVKAEKQSVLGSFSLDDIVAALPGAKVASDVPGRARLRLPLLKGQETLCELCAEALKRVPGVDEVHVSALTGSVLALYDTDEFPSLQALLDAVGA